MAHVRVCGGAGWVTTGSTRQATASSVRSCVAPASGGADAARHQAAGAASCLVFPRRHPPLPQGVGDTAHSLSRHGAILLLTRGRALAYATYNFSLQTGPSMAAYDYRRFPEEHRGGINISRNLRTQIERLVRRTICFSKTDHLHDLVLGLFINRDECGRAL
jgi:IS1 transposase